jgi:hypothetical protein
MWEVIKGTTGKRKPKRSKKPEYKSAWERNAAELNRKKAALAAQKPVKPVPVARPR